jgi:hypothetical protein
MTLDILRNMPVWVWLVLAALLIFGLVQTRRRRLPHALVFLLPAIMIALSLYSLRSSFGWQADALGSWVVGVLTALILNGAVFQSPTGIGYDGATQKFDIPGSWIPLLLMMTIFCTRFAIGVTTAVSPSTVAEPNFIRAVCALLGLCSGLFAARALRINQAGRRPL